MMNIRIRTAWPLVASLLVYWVAVASVVFLSVGLNAGRFVYPFDDTYIHMSIARNAAVHGVWGITPHEFASATSSPVWTFLLTATYFLFGVSDTAPFILALLSGTFLIGAIHVCLARYIQSPARIFVAIVILIFATPLPILTFCGMEHVLHMLLSTVFLFLAVPLFPVKGRPTLRETAPLLAVGLFLIVTRYESLFLVFLVCAIFLFQRKIALAFILGAVSLLPLLLYGAWSVAHGWHWLPASVLMKGNKPHLSLTLSSIWSQFGGCAMDVIEANPFLLVLLLFSVLVILRHALRGDRGLNGIQWAHLIFLGCLLLHMQFARTTWYFRYEAYLVFLGLALAAISVNELLPQSWIEVWKVKGPVAAGALAFFALAMGLPFYNRSVQALQMAPGGSHNIYEQQYQMATFLKRYYPDSTVAANDVGAITYYTNIRLVDLMGLGTLEVANWRIQQTLTPQKLATLTQQRGVTLAVLYESWFTSNGKSLLPPTWVKVAQWRIGHNMVCGADTVTFYATDAQGVEKLKENLRQFAQELPQDVQHAGLYSLDAKR